MSGAGSLLADGTPSWPAAAACPRPRRRLQGWGQQEGPLTHQTAIETLVPGTVTVAVEHTEILTTSREGDRLLPCLTGRPLRRHNAEQETSPQQGRAEASERQALPLFAVSPSVACALLICQEGSILFLFFLLDVTCEFSSTD